MGMGMGMTPCGYPLRGGRRGFFVWSFGEEWNGMEWCVFFIIVIRVVVVVVKMFWLEANGTAMHRRVLRALDDSP